MYRTSSTRSESSSSSHAISGPNAPYNPPNLEIAKRMPRSS